VRYNERVVKRSQLLTFTILLFASTLFAEERVLLNATFDDADLTGWKLAGDLCVAPAFCAGQPDGKYWVAFSTNSDEDSITMCGSTSVGGMESILRTPYMALKKGETRIRVDFKVKFLTNENSGTDVGNDSFIVRLVTLAGPIVIGAFDNSGVAPDSKNLIIRGESRFHPSPCASNWKYETGMLQVSYYRSFREPFLSQMVAGPVALEFALMNQFDKDFDSAVVIDDVHVSAR
jgi:hypothetical protein